MISRNIIEQLNAELIGYCQQKFTGRLEFKPVSGKQWNLYLSMGKLLWAAGSEHPTKRWYRQVYQNVPNIDFKNFKLRELDQSECWHHNALVTLARQHIINPTQLTNIIKGTGIEVFFDLFQSLELIAQSPEAKNQREKNRVAEITAIYGKKGLNGIEVLSLAEKDQFCHVSQCNIEAKDGIRPCKDCVLPISWMLNCQEVFDLAHSMWEQWYESGLGDYSPNLVPVLTNTKAIAEKAGVAVSQKLQKVIRPEITLRDLSVSINQNLLAITRSLLPYIKTAHIQLVQVKDSPRPSFANTPINLIDKPQNEILIACIDDSQITCKNIEKIIAHKKYRFLAISDPTIAMMTLLKQKPDLIFLDLMMPIINGYELCTQIRRTTSLQHIPVIILTANHELVNRVKAKLVGASGFLRKPINPLDIIKTLKKFGISTKNHLIEATTHLQ